MSMNLLNKSARFLTLLLALGLLHPGTLPAQTESSETEAEAAKEEFRDEVIRYRAAP